jgi:hypothetical protein
MANPLVQIVEVDSPAGMETTISSYVIQGYSLANKTPSTATMIKRKEFNVVWAVIGFALCIIPLLIYCITYANESDKVVEIRMRGSGSSSGGSIGELERFADLHERGVISDEEYEAQKRRLL